MKKHESIPFVKEKELFQSIRKIKQFFNLRYRLILIVTLEIVFSILFAIGVDALCQWVFGNLWAIPLWVDLLIIALLVGIFATNALTRWFIKPIKEVCGAMDKISSFTARIVKPKDYSILLFGNEFSKNDILDESQEHKCNVKGDAIAIEGKNNTKEYSCIVNIIITSFTTIDGVTHTLDNINYKDDVKG